jgi:hypothetical protein
MIVESRTIEAALTLPGPGSRSATLVGLSVTKTAGALLMVGASVGAFTGAAVVPAINWHSQLTVTTAGSNRQNSGEIFPSSEKDSTSIQEGVDMSMGLKIVPSGLPTSRPVPQMLQKGKSPIGTGEGPGVGAKESSGLTESPDVSPMVAACVGLLLGIVDGKAVDGACVGVPV